MLYAEDKLTYQLGLVSTGGSNEIMLFSGKSLEE